MSTHARQPWPARLALLAVVALAAGNFFWQLGSSSLYVDEVQSVFVAAQPLVHLVHALRVTEITPPGYFVGLHEWVTHLGDVNSDPSLRLPSALGGIALVLAVAWVAWESTGRRRAVLFAGLLASLSPFVLEHAQRAQGYVFVSLGCAVAVAGALRARRDPSRCDRWLALSLCGAVMGLLAHYVAGLAVLPLCVWLLSARELRRSRRVAYAVVCAGVELALVPLLLSQHDAFPNRPGVAGSAALSLTTAGRVIGAAFDGRVARLLWLGVAAFACSVVAIATILQRRRRWRRRAVGLAREDSGTVLVIGIAIGVPIVLIALSAVGDGGFWGHLMLSRYAAAAVPFMLVSLAATACLIPRAGLVVVAVAAGVGLTGSVASHRPSGFFFDARGITSYIIHGHRGGDVVVAPSDPGAAVPLLHYGLGALHPLLSGEPRSGPPLGHRRPRLWLISELPPNAGPAAILRRARLELAPARYSALSARVFPSVTPSVVILAAPVASGPRAAPG